MAKEKKETTEPKRTVKPKGEESGPKLTYEELTQFASQQYTEVQNLRKALDDATKRIQAYEANDFLARLEWLWRIITLEGSEEVFGDEFFNNVVKEFKLLMAPPQMDDKKS